LTNILRDVAQDYANDHRIYLPTDEMERFGYSLEALARGEHSATFCDLMQFSAERAWSYFQRAANMLPALERRRLVPAEIMRAIYEKLLDRMQRDQFQVFTKRYHLSRLEKMICIARVLLARSR
jgi:phytoene synthase